MKQNDTVLNLRIATELHDQLKALAQKKYMPLSVMVRLALMEYLTQEAPHALVAPSQPQRPMSRPMTNREYKFMREQQMRGADIPLPTQPQAPSQQLEPSEDDWL